MAARLHQKEFARDAEDFRRPNRHSGRFLAGIQTNSTTEFPCGWIPANNLPE
jgi:hypothetical protein